MLCLPRGLRVEDFSMRGGACEMGKAGRMRFYAAFETAAKSWRPQMRRLCMDLLSALGSELGDESGCFAESEMVAAEKDDALADAYNMAQVGKEIFNLLRDMDKEQVALNVTGGTKLMAIAAFAMFKEAGYPSFYFTANSNEVLLLDNNKRLSLKPPKIKIEDYLMLHGYPARHKLQKQLTHREWLPFAEELVRAKHRLESELGQLNYKISKADKRALKCKVPAGTVAHNMQYLLELLEKYGLARQQGGCLVFADEEAKQYAAGGWFEDYVFQTAKSLPGVQDVALNVQIENAKEQVFQH
ncbi:Card1-like endonuclease domain-containing protein [Neisseria musculi]|uniref:Card1-like endonuclease domain-containing protein n=1 Tax=Neisseria musculi TaxID=1815583 RepID=UPI00336BC796